ncbi:MAG: DUF1446 domain-containing protein [Pseudonocardia sp.]|nr:DUF1446 domain-containing protein [Pseudonocardia sp.]
MSRTPIRIGNFSGYLGDRFTAIDEVLAGDPVDVLMGDYLAEVTLAALAVGYRKNARGGYVAYVAHQLEPHLATLAERGIKVVTNAGGFNPSGHVLDRLAEFHTDGHGMEHLDTGAPLKDWGVEPIAANSPGSPASRAWSSAVSRSPRSPPTAAA